MLSKQFERRFHSCFSRGKRRCALLYGFAIAYAFVASGAPPSASFERGTKSNETVIAEVRVAVGGDALVLPVAIGETVHRLILDTGSIVCCLDESLVDRLQPAPDAKILGAPEPAPALYRAPSMRLGNMDLGRPEFALLPGLHATLLPNGIDIDGFLGINVLRHHVVQIDFESGIVRFLRAAGRDCGTKIPLQSMDARFHVTGNVAGEETSFLIDTGNVSFGAGSLRKPLFDRLVGSGTLRLFTGRQDNAWTSAGIVPKRVAEAESMVLGPFQHRRLIFSDTAQYSKLGLGYLSRFEVTFDFPHSVMYLRPTKYYSRQDAIVLGGFGIAYIAGKAICAEIEPNGAAAAAGLEEWDELESVDGAEVKGMSSFALSRLFTRPGRIKITYRRDDQERKTVIILRDARPELVTSNPTKGRGPIIEKNNRP